MKIIIGLSEAGKVSVREFFKRYHKTSWSNLDHAECFKEALSKTRDGIEGLRHSSYELGSHETKSKNPETWHPMPHHFIYENIEE